CRMYYLIHQIILVLTQFVVSAVLIIRTYALYGRDKRILALLLTGAVCLIAALSWAEQGQQSIPDSLFPGCNLGITLQRSVHIIDLSVSWIAVFLFDTLILSLTVRRTYLLRRELGGGSMPLHMLIARDYFAMALANLTNIITYYVCSVSRRISSTHIHSHMTQPLLRGSLATFSNCVSVSIMSRLMLNLHEEASTGILSEFTVDHTSLVMSPRPVSDCRQQRPSIIPPIRQVSELRMPEFSDDPGESNPERIEEVLRDRVV
ncbi:hypothetical protein FB45DRAFT_751509, partial [Roridomyces roridus]